MPALEIDPDSVKALYRRAFAREAKGEYDNAKADLKRAAELAPEDTAVPKLMTRVEAQIARQKAKEKKMCAACHTANHAAAASHTARHAARHTATPPHRPPHRHAAHLAHLTDHCWSLLAANH